MITLLFGITLLSGNVYASDQILISISSDLNKVIFDGKWTHTNEWKRSSEDRLRYDDGTRIQLRTAHQGNFIYVFIDAISDVHIDKGADRALVCFDTKNDKTKVPNSDDYCFSVTLDRKNPFTYQGGGLLAVNNHFSKIANPDGFIGIGSVSDKNDRYNKIPHASYEFRIPLDVLGRSSNYGFYVSVFDAYTQNNYSWPYEINTSGVLTIPSPNQWGELVSPDKSLPEFSSSTWIIIPAFLFVVSLSYLKKHVQIVKD